MGFSSSMSAMGLPGMCGPHSLMCCHLQAIVSCEKLDAMSCHLAGIRKLLQDQREANALAAAVQQDVLMLDMDVPEPAAAAANPLQLQQHGDATGLEANHAQDGQQAQQQIEQQRQQQQQQREKHQPEEVMD